MSLKKVISEKKEFPVKKTYSTKPEAKNKSYIFAYIDTNQLRDVKLVLAPDNKTCIEKILNKYALFDEMIEYLLDDQGDGGIENINSDEMKKANKDSKTRKAFLEAKKDEFFSWFPAFIKDAEGTGWDCHIVDKLI